MVKAAPIIEADRLESFIDNQDSDSHNSKKNVSSLIFVRMEAENVVHYVLLPVHSVVSALSLSR